MAVTVDAVGPSGGGGTNGSSGAGPWTHTCSGTNRAVIVGVSVENTTFSSTTLTATYDGVTMTSFGAINSNNNTAGFVQLFGLVNPPTGAKSVVVTASPTAGQNVIAGSVSFNGVDQTTPFGSGVTAAGDNSSGSAPPSRTVSSATGDMVVDAICYGAALNGSLGTQQVLDNNSTASAAGNLMVATYSGAATVTAGANPTNHDWWGIVAVDVKAAAGGGSTVNGTATLAGAGSLAAAVVQRVTASPAGVGSLSASVTQRSAATASGAGTLSALVTQRATAGPTGAGSLSALATQQVTATLTGAGALAAVGSSSGGATASLAGAGSLSAKATQSAPVALAGAGSLAASVTQGGKAALAGAGSLTAAGVIAGAGVLAGAGALTGTVRQLAGVALAGAGALSVSAGGVVAGSASLVGSGVLTINLNPCVTPRPFSGTTSRPGAGITARPDTGITEDSC